MTASFARRIAGALLALAAPAADGQPRPAAEPGGAPGRVVPGARTREAQREVERLERESARALVRRADTVTAAAHDRLDVRVFGDSAEVTGVLRLRGRGARGAFDRRTRFTHTWARRDGRWRRVDSTAARRPGDR